MPAAHASHQRHLLPPRRARALRPRFGGLFRRLEGRPGRPQRRRQVDAAAPDPGPDRGRQRRDQPDGPHPRSARCRRTRPAATSPCSTPCWRPTSSAAPCWPRIETCHDGDRLAEIHARLDEIGAALGAVPRRLDPERPRLRQREAAPALRRVLRRLADARGAGRHAVQRPRPADPRRAVQPSRPRSDAVADRASEAIPQHRPDGQPRPRPAERRVRPHRPHRPAEAGRLHRQLRLLRAHARRAPGQRCRPAGQGRRPAQAHAGLRRPLQGQGQQGAPGTVAHEDDREAGAGRQRADRRDASRSTSPRPRSWPRRSRRSTRSPSAIPTGRWCCATSTCASTWKTASRCWARTATASRPSSA